MGLFTNSIHPAAGEGLSQEGGIIAVKHLTNGSNLSSTNNIPRDNSAPTISEGIELFTVSHSLAVSTNKLIFFLSLYGNEDSNQGDTIAAALFAGSTCIYVGMLNASLNVQNYDTCHHTFMYSRGSTDATTYSLRCGVEGGTYEHINNMTYASNSEYNQLRHSSFTLMEASST